MSHPQKASVKINVHQPQHEISPDLYGLFFEEINHAGEGGLYPERIQNRSFCDGVAPSDFVRDAVDAPADARGWVWQTPTGLRFPMKDKGDFPGWRLEAADSDVRVVADDTVILSEATPRSLRLVFGPGAPRQATLVNEGYWGIAVSAHSQYRLTIIARTEASPVEIQAELRDSEGTVARCLQTVTQGGAWVRQEAILETQRAATNAELALRVTGAGSVWFSFVSLFPLQTWRNRPNGMRPELAEMLAALKPAFLRFPGGCVVEGVSRSTYYDWKSSLGPVELRQGRWNLWGYATTQGIGFHEYLQFAEDLGADAMYVCNCGMSCQFRNPDYFDEALVDTLLQDALDAVEYALGPVHSLWGARRAANGHPAPFALRYLEIGNENWGEEYQKRYGKFYEAIHARYPDLILIADNRVEGAPLDVLDEHFYSTPSDLMRLSRRYDRADRNGPKIYVGEYAVTGECGQGNLKAAVAEAAFLTGLERNSDVVKMASYAPLLVNVQDRSWNPDLIQFDNHRCAGTPSYWVQRMFVQHQGAHTVPIAVDCEHEIPSLCGGFGFVTWESVAEFRNLRVVCDDEVLYENDLSGAFCGLVPQKGDWQFVEGALRSSQHPRDGFCLLDGDAAWENYTLTCQARQIGPGNGFMIAFLVQGQRHYRWQIGGWNNMFMGLEEYNKGGCREICARESITPVPGQWYDVRVEVDHGKFRCYLDGKKLQEAEELPMPTLAAGATLSADGKEIIIKLANGCDRTQVVDLDLGHVDVEPRGSEQLLFHTDPDAENSLDAPERVAPQENQIDGLAARFPYTMRPWSVAILTLTRKPLG